MGVHLLKTAAGLQDLDQLVERQAGNKIRHEGREAVYAYTRYAPKRAAEIIEGGGSIYWILKNRIQARQQIWAFDMVTEADGFIWCRIILDPLLYQTVAVQKRAIQGWRYLEASAAPKDRGLYSAGQGAENDPPPEMAEELRRLGLL